MSENHLVKPAQNPNAFRTNSRSPAFLSSRITYKVLDPNCAFVRQRTTWPIGVPDLLCRWMG
jgi:hypothetical protein